MEFRRIINTNFPDNWSDKDKIEYLQRRIIISSIIYYELNNNIIEDKEFDRVSQLLVQMQNSYGNINNTQYGYCMYDFDGTTGFHLYDRLTDNDKKRLTTYAVNETKVNTKGVK